MVVKRTRAGSIDAPDSARMQDARVHAAEYSLQPMDGDSPAVGSLIRAQLKQQAKALSSAGGGLSGMRRSTSAPDLAERPLSAGWSAPVNISSTDLLTAVAA